VSALTDALSRQKFDILFCDETASQSGRILPLEAVARFCRQHSVTLVVDGTQSCQLLFARNKKEILDQV
jgi:selenocysteine lyase/cysteine desulfurase